MAQFVTNDVVKGAGRPVIGGLDAGSALVQLNYVLPVLKIFFFIQPLKVQLLEDILSEPYSHSSSVSLPVRTGTDESVEAHWTPLGIGLGDGDVNGDR